MTWKVAAADLSAADIDHGVIRVHGAVCLLVRLADPADILNDVVGAAASPHGSWLVSPIRPIREASVPSERWSLKPWFTSSVFKDLYFLFVGIFSLK